MSQNDGPMRNGEMVSVQGTATVSGTVLDSTGALIQGARVSLALRDGSQLQTVKSSENGQFAFVRVPAGSYLVTVEAAGFATFRSQEFSVTAKQAYLVPGIPLLVAGSTTSLTVRPPRKLRRSKSSKKSSNDSSVSSPISTSAMFRTQHLSRPSKSYRW